MIKNSVVCLLFVMSFALVANGNIIKNGDFENGLENWEQSFKAALSVIKPNYGLKKSDSNEKIMFSR